MKNKGDLSIVIVKLPEGKQQKWRFSGIFWDLNGMSITKRCRISELLK